jgi:uncharacterized protein YndB with AHSA1/START domain
MDFLGRTFCMIVVLAAAAGCTPLGTRAPDEFQQEGTRAVINMSVIAGPPAAVFDLVTTARFWPQWHPATMAVGGVTERPYRLRDHIYERARIGTIDFQVVWTVVEHVPATRVVLQSSEPPARIIYTFETRGGETVFTRRLEYRPDSAAAPAAQQQLDTLVRAQSA